MALGRRVARSWTADFRAYLWVDTENCSANYSAAGHPSLLCWRRASGRLERIESSGLLFGVTAETEYPVCKLRLEPIDRLLIYTDGMVEPESLTGEAFGE